MTYPLTELYLYISFKPPKITPDLQDIILTIERLLHKTVYLVLFIQNNNV